MNAPRATFDLIVYGGDDCGAALVAEGSKALWIRPRTPDDSFPVGYVGNGEVERTARLIFGDRVVDRLWDLSRETLELCRAHVPGRVVPVRWRLPHGDVEEDGWLGEKPPRFPFKAATLMGVHTLGSFRYALDLATEQGVETIETAALVLADETLPPKLFPALRETWLVPACTEIVGVARTAPEGLTLEHAGVDYAFRRGGILRTGSFRGLQDDGSLKRPLAPSVRGVEALRLYYGEKAGWLDLSKPYEARVYEAALSCDGLPVVGPLSEAPGVFVVGAFAARERNLRAGAVRAVLAALAGRRSPRVEAFRPGRFS